MKLAEQRCCTPGLSLCNACDAHTLNNVFIVIVRVLLCRYGPRQSERKFGFSDRGRLVCEVNYVSLAQKSRGKQAQVGYENSGSCGAQQQHN